MARVSVVSVVDTAERTQADGHIEAEDENDACAEYMDLNLDWSFATLKPHIEKILKNDNRSFMRPNTEISNTTDKRCVPRFRGSRVRYSFDPVNLDTGLENLTSWDFNIFEAGALIGHHVAVPLAKRILMSHGLLQKFKISHDLCDRFLVKIVKHYRHLPFHNSIHAADVMQTVNCLMVGTGFINVLDDLEILCVLLTALMHDIEHTGTNNSFHRNSRTMMGKLYLTSILENHHLRVALGLLRLFDVLASLTKTQYDEFKDMLCAMILSTDISNHFALITNMKIISECHTKCSSRSRIRRVLMMLVHAADVSNGAKPWNVHKIWVSLFCQESFKQGDRERNMGHPISPNCDKFTINLATSQIGFIQTFIVESYHVLDLLLRNEVREADGEYRDFKPWVESIHDNMMRWKKSSTSFKYTFVNEFLREIPQSTQSDFVGYFLERKMKRRSKWLCCCPVKHEKHLFNLAEYSSTTVP